MKEDILDEKTRGLWLSYCEEKGLGEEYKNAKLKELKINMDMTKETK